VWLLRSGSGQRSLATKLRAFICQLLSFTDISQAYFVLLAGRHDCNSINNEPQDDIISCDWYSQGENTHKWKENLCEKWTVFRV
jgi:hypothetical protein